MPIIKKGSLNVTRYVYLIDSTTFLPATGLTLNTIDLQYTRNQNLASTKVDATGLGAADDPHTDNSVYEIDATSSPGLYRVDWPDAAFATGVDRVILCVSHANIVPAFEEIELTDLEPFDATPTLGNVTYGTVTMSRLVLQGTNANGILFIQNTGTGHAVHVIGAGAAKNAVKLVSDNGDALDITSSNSRGALIKAGGGDALKLEGGLTDGAAIHLAGGTTNGDAIKTAPQGTGEHFSGLIDVGFINGNATAAARLATSSALMEIGTVASGTPSTTAFISSLTEATDDHYNDRLLYWTSGANAGQAKTITDYNGTTKTITTGAFTDAPSVTDAFIII